MFKSKEDLDIALLSWARLNNRLSTDSTNRDSILSDLEKLESYLSHNDLKDIRILNKSADYYTLSFLLDGESRIKQLLTEDVEGQL